MSIKLNKELIEKSLVNKGDISRILKLYEKAEKGEDITIAFLGGSITQGCNSTVYEKCYVELVSKWFENKFKLVNVKHINAGVGATGSLIGVHRAEKQVLSKDPDIIFVDAAVNDNDSDYCKISYESEIRKLLSSKNKPAVVEVFMTMVDGVNYQDAQIKIGFNYNVPMISFRNTANELVEKYNLKWSDLLTDEVHPNDDGHEIISELLVNFLEDIYMNNYNKGESIEVKDNTLEKKCVYGDRYINGRILNNKELRPKEIIGFHKYEEGFQVFHNGWRFIGKANEGGKLMIETECNNIILLYKKTISENSGKFKVRVNGVEKALIDTHFKDGWGDCTVTEILEEYDYKKTYEIEIEVISEEKDREVTILGVMVS